MPDTVDAAVRGSCVDKLHVQRKRRCGLLRRRGHRTAPGKPYSMSDGVKYNLNLATVYDYFRWPISKTVPILRLSLVTVASPRATPGHPAVPPTTFRPLSSLPCSCRLPAVTLWNLHSSR